MLASWSELVVVVGVGALLYGPKDLPHAARAAGKLVGQGVAFLKQVRKGADSFAKEHELLQLHKDVRKSLMELNSIRSEIHQAGAIMPPPMYGQVPLNRLQQHSPLGAQHLGNPDTAQVAMQHAHQPTSQTATPSPTSNPTLSHMSRQTEPSSRHAGGALSWNNPAAGNGAEQAIGSRGGDGRQDKSAQSAMVTYGAPSSEAAIMFAPKTDTLAGGADHLIELLHLRERMLVTATSGESVQHEIDRGSASSRPNPRL